MNISGQIEKVARECIFFYFGSEISRFSQFHCSKISSLNFYFS
jgi:hypothetical protein